MKTSQKVLTGVIALFIVASGIVIMQKMATSRRKVHPPTRPEQGILVEVMPAVFQHIPAVIHATGTVQPRRQAQISPQVSGTVVRMASSLVDGGFVKKDDVLFVVDPSDYRFQVTRWKDQVARAELDLAMAKKKAAIASEEWQQLHPNSAPDPLAVHIPQLKQARTALAKARAELALAELNLSRTRITAPFAGRILSESIDTGQYVRAGTVVATLAGSDHAEIVIPLSRTDLKWIELPRREDLTAGAKMAVFLASQPRQKIHGRIIRSLGQVDPKDRMVRVIGLINDPFGLKAKQDRPLLAPNTFVQVEIAGRTMKKVIRIPEQAMHQDNTIHVMDSEKHLRILPVTIVRREKNNLFIRAKIKPADRILLTRINGAADGMLLRTATARGKQ